MHFRASLQQWSEGGGCGKGFPIMGVAPKSREGTARRLLGFPPSPLGELLHSQEQSGVEHLAGIETHSQTCGLCAPARAGPRFLSPVASFPPPRLHLQLASAPPLLKSPRDPARAAEAAAGTRAPRRVLGQSARSPRRRRAAPRASRSPGGSSRGEPNRTEPSRAKPSRGRRAREAAVLSPGELARGGPG